MTRKTVLLLAGCLAWAAAPCRADDVVDLIVPAAAAGTAAVEATAPAVEATAAAPAPAAEAVETPGTECGPAAHATDGPASWAGRFMPTGACARRAWDWLTYHPQSGPRWCTGCGRTCAPTCVPPLYTYFLWHCEAGCGAGSGHCGGTPSAEPAPASQGEIAEAATPSPQ